MPFQMKHMRLPFLFRSAGALALLVGCASVYANDFPTLDRVLYVQECIRNHPGPMFEMTSKCACALDTIAAEVKHEEYVTMSTIAKAMSIGGERGNSIRDAPSLEPQLKRYRALESKAQRACFITDGQK